MVWCRPLDPWGDRRTIGCYCFMWDKRGSQIDVDDSHCGWLWHDDYFPFICMWREWKRLFASNNPFLVLHVDNSKRLRILAGNLPRTLTPTFYFAFWNVYSLALSLSVCVWCVYAGIYSPVCLSGTHVCGWHIAATLLTYCVMGVDYSVGRLLPDDSYWT
jgi:hypothetical protein